MDIQRKELSNSTEKITKTMKKLKLSIPATKKSAKGWFSFKTP
jgi:hypothetical protein